MYGKNVKYLTPQKTFFEDLRLYKLAQATKVSARTNDHFKKQCPPKSSKSICFVLTSTSNIGNFKAFTNGKTKLSRKSKFELSIHMSSLAASQSLISNQEGSPSRRPFNIISLDRAASRS